MKTVQMDLARFTERYSTREAYKSLRTNLLFCGQDVRSVMVTSCVKNEGKSTISLALANSLAESGKRALVIDADLRKSVIVGKYVQSEEKILGLSEYLSGQASYEDVLYQINDSGLYAIFAGFVPPNPVELLASEYFGALLDRVRNEFDYIIIDAPPLGAVIDAAVIAAKCDGALMIVAANRVSYRFAREVKAQIDKSGCRLLGVVLNRVPERAHGLYKGYYYNKYYRHYDKYSKEYKK